MKIRRPENLRPYTYLSLASNPTLLKPFQTLHKKVLDMTVTKQQRRNTNARLLLPDTCHAPLPDYMCVCVSSVAHQAPLSMGFSKQKYWSGLSFPTPGDLPDPGIKPVSLASPALAGRFLNTGPPYSLAGGGGGAQFLRCCPTVFPLWLAKKYSHSFFVLHNSVSIFLFDISSQRVKILAGK